jgi:hypothetical protein
MLDPASQPWTGDDGDATTLSSGTPLGHATFIALVLASVYASYLLRA